MYEPGLPLSIPQVTIGWVVAVQMSVQMSLAVLSQHTVTLPVVTHGYTLLHCSSSCVTAALCYCTVHSLSPPFCTADLRPAT